VKFSPRVFINGNKQSLGNRKVYEFMIATDHILLFDISLLKFEDNEDVIISQNNWNHVVFSYVDHINNDGVPIKVAAKYSGIHVSQQRSAMEEIQFTTPPQSSVSVNLYPNSTETQKCRGEKKSQFFCLLLHSYITQPVFSPLFCFCLFMFTDHNGETPKRADKGVTFPHSLVVPTSTSNC
jgi:hypothetical protein